MSANMFFTRFSFFAVVSCVLLSGCAARPVYLVDDADLTQLESQMASQAAQLEALKVWLAQENQQLKQQFNDLERRQQTMLRHAPVSSVGKAALSECQGESAGPQASGKMLVGGREKIYLVGPAVAYTARIDSGAETSSIDARNITRFERDGDDWVRFDIPEPGNESKLITMERKLVRNVKVIQSVAEDAERRAVVELQFVIGNHRQLAEFTLSTRHNLTDPVLVGRNILRDMMLVDVGRAFITDLPKEFTQPRKSDN